MEERVSRQRVKGLGFRVQGSGFRVQASGCRVQGAEFKLGTGCVGRQMEDAMRIDSTGTAVIASSWETSISFRV